jgi:ZIP family zinc transporter
MFQQDDEWMPLYLSCLAGASTCLGAAVVFFHPTDSNNLRIVSPNTMSFSLALAGSVMVTVSVISLGPECLIMDDGVFVPLYQFFQRIVSFCIGSSLYFGLSWFAFPEPEEVIGMELSSKKNLDDEEAMRNIDETLADTENSARRDSTKTHNVVVRSRKKDELSSKKTVADEEVMRIKDETSAAVRSHKKFEDDEQPLILREATANIVAKPSSSWTQWSTGADLDSKEQKRAWRVAMLLFVSILLHNFPEGLAVAASALESRKLGITVTVGIMIHNIPEGIAIAIPCLAARPDSPWLGFALASLSGLAEPAGAFVALLCLRGVASKQDATFMSMENVLAFVAGIMIMVSLYELFPEANRHTSLGNQYVVAGTVCGIVVMVATELYI